MFSSSSRLLSAWPLYLVLAIPILAPAVISVSLGLLLSREIVQRSAQEQAERLHQEISYRVEDHLEDFLSQPATVLRLTAQEIDSGVLDSTNLKSLESHFWAQSRVFEQLDEIYWGDRNGQSLGIIHRADGSRELATGELQPGTRSLIALTEDGDRGAVLKRYLYDPRLRPWYQTASASGEMRWSDVYRWSNRPVLGMTLTNPQYDTEAQLESVFAIDVNLESIQNFLRSLSVPEQGQVFIVDQYGLLVASSTDDLPFIVANNEVERIAPTASDNLLMRGIARMLEMELGHFEQLEKAQVLRYLPSDLPLSSPDAGTDQRPANRLRQVSHLVRVSPWRDPYGIQWSIVVAVPEENIAGPLNQNIQRILLINGLSFSLSIGVSLGIAHWLALQLKANASKIQTQKAALEQRSETLAQAVEQLKTTQNQLVEASKMAALGRLVAGVAHEVNTPIGTALLAASTLQNEAKDFSQQLSSARIQTASGPTTIPDAQRVAQAEGFTEDLEAIQSCSQLIMDSLRRADRLIQSFKQVAVDQSQIQIRKIQLKSYIQEVLGSLAPQIRLAGHQIDIVGNQQLAIETDPGAISQIFTNLLLNSFRHAYEQSGSGQIIIRIEATSSGVQLLYEDDGKGIATEQLARIFEPFFTADVETRGTGLGLHLVYNLVTQQLQGAVSVKSTLGQGTQFIIQLPHSLDSEASIASKKLFENSAKRQI